MPRFIDIDSTLSAEAAATAKAAMNADSAIDIRDHGAIGDAVAITDAVTAIGSAVLTSASNLFTASMVGKTVVVLGAAAGAETLVTTVASYQSAGQVTLATTAGAVAIVRGGPNVNAIIGTDNSAAFASAFDEAAELADTVAGSTTYGLYNKLQVAVKPVYVAPGSYLALTGIPTLQERGHALFGESTQGSLVWYCGEGPFLEMGTFDATTANSNVYYGTSSNLRVSDLTLCAPIYVGAEDTAKRVGIGIQDNGSGHLDVNRVWMYGFDYGIYATSASDFSEISGSAIISCNIGVYLGPGSQQFVAKGVMFYNNDQGLIVEGSPQGTVVGCSFVANTTADVTFDGVISGNLTRAGLSHNAGGAGEYFGPWAFYNTWFESFGTRPGPPQHIWIKSAKRPEDGVPAGWQGLSFSDCILISGGTQVGAATTAFINDAGVKAANPLVTNLVIQGKYINCVYRYSGADSTFSPVLDYYAQYTGDIAAFMDDTVAASAGTTLPGVITSPSTLTLSNTNIDNTTITNGTFTSPKIQYLNTPVNSGRVVQLDGVASSVNYFQLNNAATGGAPTIYAAGSDTNINLQLRAKGSGVVQAWTGSGYASVATRLTNTAALNFGSVSAHSEADLTITVSGAATGDAVALGVPTASVTAGIAFTAWVSATNTVTVRAHNYTAGPLDPVSGTFRATVIQ